MTNLHFGVGPIELFMAEDHVRLDELLATADADANAIDLLVYGQFRRGLLRHIAMEEKVLLPYARAKLGKPLVLAAALRADHSKIAKLLVRSPTQALLFDLRDLLGVHNALEEGADGLYAICDRIAGNEAPEVVARLRAQPQVPVAKYFDGRTVDPRTTTRPVLPRQKLLH